ncbi:unnamed protein product, partial [Ixodes hexagonus]
KRTHPLRHIVYKPQAATQKANEALSSERSGTPALATSGTSRFFTRKGNILLNGGPGRSSRGPRVKVKTRGSEHVRPHKRVGQKRETNNTARECAPNTYIIPRSIYRARVRASRGCRYGKPL